MLKKSVVSWGCFVKSLYKKKPKIIIKEIPVEVEKIVEKEVIKEVPSKKLPSELKGAVLNAFKHARRRGIKVPDNPDRFFEN